VLGATAGVNAVQFAVPGTLQKLERTPAGLHGDGWRTFTSLFVQDGGVFGTASNLVFLVLVGTIAEQVVSRPRWLVQYFGVGLAIELLAYSWQPTGGGNSIAVCGLTGAVGIALATDDERLPGFADLAVLLWCGALIGTTTKSAYIVAVGACVASSAATRIAIERGVVIHRWVAAAVLAVGVVLSVLANIHGAALILGFAAALVPSGLRRFGGPVGQDAVKDLQIPAP
jgi:membrane associated rhomboid family serine protease